MLRVYDADRTLALHWSNVLQTSCDSTAPLFIVCLGSVKVTLEKP